MTYSKVERHPCAQCGGVWYDRAEMELLADELKIQVTFPFGPEEAGRARACPRCRAAMSIQRAGEGGKILLDVCGQHGVWFDREELEPVLEELQAHASTAPRRKWWEWPLAVLDYLGNWDLRNRRGLGGTRPPRDLS